MRLKFLLILLQVPPLILLMSAMAVVSLYTLNNSVNDWTGKIQAHVLTEERTHIVDLAENVALFTSRRFRRMTADALVVRDYAQQLVNQSLVVTNPYKSYHVNPSIDTSAPNSIRDASGWFRLHNTNAAQQPFLNTSSALDNVWRTLPSLYQASGIGLESDGLFRAFPFSRSSTRSTMTSLCHINNTQVTGYDPRCRSWYTGAKALSAGTTVDVFYTAPYVDARTGDIIISASAPIWHPDPNPTKLFGVVFNDISFNNLESFYDSNKILESGFPILLDDTTAQLLYYPGMSRAGPQYFRGLHFESETSSESIAFSTSFNASAAQAKATFSTISFTYTRYGKVWQASVSSVNGTNYMVGVVVPEVDIRKPVQDVIDAATAALTGALVGIIIVIVVMILASVFLNVNFSDTITTVIYTLVEVTDRFARGEFDTEEDGEKEKSDILEVYNIQDSFHKLALAVQFSNPEYFKGNTVGALDVSMDVEKMLTASENYRGLGVVQNNIALYVHSLDSSRDRIVVPYLKKSIQSGEAAVTACRDMEDEDCAAITIATNEEQYVKQEFSVAAVKSDEELEKIAECRALATAVNNRQLNVAAVTVSTDEDDYHMIIETARSLQDPNGVVAGYLRFAEASELKDRAEDALLQRRAAVQAAVDHLTRTLKSEGFQAALKNSCEAVFDAALQMALIRQLSVEDDTAEPLHSEKLAVMYQHLNLCLLASALMEKEGLPPHSELKKAQTLLAHVLAMRGDKTTSNAMVEKLELKLNPKRDLAPVKPGMTVTVENLLSGEAQEIGGEFYNEAAVAGDFGDDVEYDKYGNPIGSTNELAADGAFEGMRILIGNFDPTDSQLCDDILELCVPELKKKGFAVDLASPENFCQELIPEKYGLAWIISGASPDQGGARINEHRTVEAVRKFHEAGRGLMIWGENEPYFHHSNIILEPIFKMRLTGNTPGGKDLEPGGGFDTGKFSRDHLLATGILKIYEGATVCYPEYKDEDGKWNLEEAEGWTRMGTSSDGYSVLVARDSPDVVAGPGRVVVDNGYTKLLSQFWATAGNARYVSNCAAWLSMCERPRNRPGAMWAPIQRPAKVLQRAQAQVANNKPDPQPKLYTLRETMAVRFGIAYFIFIFLVFIVCLSISLGTTDRVSNDLRAALQDQVQRQATSLMEGVASAFGEDLATASESGTDMIAQATADVFRTTPQYCLAPRTSYYDLGGTTTDDFKQPTEIHQGYVSSLQASSFYVPEVLGDASNLTASENATADTTSHLDPLFASIYSHRKDDYFILAAGFEENSAFRRMPARDTNLIDPTRAYDPTQRGWYRDAEKNAGSINPTIYTPPYRGASSNRWMISVASAARSESNTMVGVSIVDILLATLTNSVRALRVLDTGKITLIDYASGSSGSAAVVADQEWAMSDASGHTVFTLDKLVKPAVSYEMQRFITSTPLAGAEGEASNTRSATFGTTYDGEAGSQNVMVIPTRLSGFGNRYYFTAFVRESEVFAAFEPLLAEIQAVKTGLSLILLAVWACACVVAALTIYAASRLVAGPILAIEGNVQRMVENVGGADLTNGCEDISSAPYDSAKLLAKNFNAMVKTMRASAQAQIAETASPLTAGNKKNFSSTQSLSMDFVPSFTRDTSASPPSVLTAGGGVSASVAADVRVLPEGTADLACLWDGSTLRTECPMDWISPGEPVQGSYQPPPGPGEQDATPEELDPDSLVGGQESPLPPARDETPEERRERKKRKKEKKEKRNKQRTDTEVDPSEPVTF